jgi:hypothetical protein
MDYIEKLPNGKYLLTGNNLVLAEGVPYSLASVSEDRLVIRIDARGINVAEHQIVLYRDAVSNGVPVALEGLSETIQSILAESKRRESLLKSLIETVGISDQRRTKFG